MEGPLAADAGANGVVAPGGGAAGEEGAALHPGALRAAAVARERRLCARAAAPRFALSSMRAAKAPAPSSLFDAASIVAPSSTLTTASCACSAGISRLRRSASWRAAIASFPAASRWPERGRSASCSLRRVRQRSWLWPGRSGRACDRQPCPRRRGAVHAPSGPFRAPP